MNRLKPTTLMLICLATLVIASAQAQQYPGYYPWGYPGVQPPAGNTPQFRPQEQPQRQESSRSVPSSNQPAWPQLQAPAPYNYQQQTPYAYQQQQPAASYQPPQVEVSISETDVYEQQSLIYKIRVNSSSSLKTISPELPRDETMVLRQLGDMVNTTQAIGNQQNSVSEFTYILMPLRKGTLNIPPATVRGTYAAPGGMEGPEFQVVARNHLALEVKSAKPEILPWLPLHDLRIEVSLEDTDAPSVEKPVKLEIKLSAVGTTGSQLPAIGSLLDDSLFRIYPDRSSSDGRVSVDGRALTGSRTESFTLIPRYGGLLEIPSPVINWWNVDLNTLSQARGPLQRIQVKGPPRPETDTGDVAEDTGLAGWFWLPMLIAAGLLFYSWIRAFSGPGRSMFPAWIGNIGRTLLGELYAPLASAWAKISPQRHLHTFRTAVGRRLPVSWKLWYCLRAVSQEDDPEHWAHALQILANKHLGIRRHSNLEVLGREIVACHPKADAEIVRKLMHELDRDIYGHQTIDSFPRWKAEFQAQIKPRLLSLKVHTCEPGVKTRQQLPGLNPR